MSRPLRIFGLILLLVAGALVLERGLAPDLAAIRRSLFVGSPLLEVLTPDSGDQRPLGGIEVVVRFPREHRVAPETFRCLLNGEDVTDQLTVGRNGAGGSVYPLQEGTNTLRFEVFGRGWWATRYFEDSVEVDVRASGPIRFDMA